MDSMPDPVPLTAPPAPALLTAEGASPAMAQWFAAKAEHPDALLFFRMGDFFEMFFADAEAASAALDIALSHRGEHQGQRIAMCGVPAHSHESYLARLIRRGFRVAICEQMETPEEAKRRKAPAVHRQVVRLVTPGTVTEETLLEAARPAWLLALAPLDDTLGAAWLDLSTGAFETEALDPADLHALLARLEPAETLAPASLGLAGAVETSLPRDATRRVAEAYGLATLDGFGEYHPAEVAAAAMALDYVKTTQRGRGDGALAHLSRPVPRGRQGVLQMDAATRRSLEILRPARDEGGTRGNARDCLLGAVDRTMTAAGGRLLAARLACPLAEAEPILARHDAVAALLTASGLRGTIRATLRGAPDMARALARLSLDRFAPRDLAAIRDGLARAAA
ncbi:MAG: mismatch repair protein MutS, partial [Belnapia sp.]|nr:mismatch repair protein MutS [Belnapia sp.]